MALGFLADAAAGVAPMAGGIGNLLSAFGVGKPKVKYTETPSEREAKSLIMALSQPNNSLVEQESQGMLQKGMNDFLMALKQKQMLDARRQARGLRGTFFAPERADETLDYLTSRSLPTLGLQARDAARQNIANRAQALMGFVPQEQGRQSAQNEDRIKAFQNLQMKGGFGGLAQGGMQGISNFLQALSPNSLPWQSAGNVRPSFLGGGNY